MISSARKDHRGRTWSDDKYRLAATGTGCNELARDLDALIERPVRPLMAILAGTAITLVSLAG